MPDLTQRPSDWPRWIATVGGVGYLPRAPGTWGSAAACLLYIPLFAVGGVWAVALGAALVFALGVWALGQLERASGRHDPQEAVIDEVAGQWVTLLPAGGDPLIILLAFGAFRLFDITKPWPARSLDRSRIIGWSGMLDDLAAGVYGALAVWVVMAW